MWILGLKKVICCYFICPLSEFHPNRALTENGHYHYEVVPQISDHNAQAIFLQGYAQVKVSVFICIVFVYLQVFKVLPPW